MSTETRTVKYDFRPGIMRESTEYAAEGGWFDGNRVRFRDGKPESIRGWQKKSTSSFIGTGRVVHNWAALMLTVLQQIHMSMYVRGHKQVEEQVLERIPVVLLQSKEITESVLLIIILLLLL